MTTAFNPLPVPEPAEAAGDILFQQFIYAVLLFKIRWKNSKPAKYDYNRWYFIVFNKMPY